MRYCVDYVCTRILNKKWIVNLSFFQEILLIMIHGSNIWYAFKVTLVYALSVINTQLWPFFPVDVIFVCM